MTIMNIAVIADIHGNLPAMEAVAAALERLQPDYVALNGDLINGIPFSAQVIDRVRATDWLVIRGNHEFYYLDFGTERAVPDAHNPERWGQLHWLVKHISPEQGGYLATLPDECTFYLPGTQPLRMAHGVPGRNRVGFYHEQSDEQILAEIHDIPEATLVSAHTHIQIDRHVICQDDPAALLDAMPHPDHGGANGRCARHRWHVINPGSVGLPINGDVRAQFAILSSVPDHVEPGGWRVTHHRIDYDRRPALAAYETSGMLEAGGVISRLFYWEVVTAEPEIIYFYRWGYKHGYDPDADIRRCLDAYIEATGRDQYVRARDPLINSGS